MASRTVITREQQYKIPAERKLALTSDLQYTITRQSSPFQFITRFRIPSIALIIYISKTDN
ncbi:hypothetical protein CS542_03405 [Pedobacter sp. IW39]|nr:hypothetical protein CS542_03405 [Pedobacter sp. IW39]